MKRPGFTPIITLIMAVLLVGAVVATVVTEEDRREAAARAAMIAAAESETTLTLGGEVELDTVESETIELQPTPMPTPQPFDLPEGAVEIWSDRKPIVAVASRAEAETILTDYLKASMIETATERTLRATFTTELLIVDATGKLPLTERDAAIAMLTGDAKLVPVYLETERRELQHTSPTLQVKEDAALPRGSILVSQLGTGLYAATTTQLTYTGGEIVSGGDPVSETLLDARATIIRKGTYLSEKPNAEPDRKQGVEGRENENLHLLAPIRGTRVSSNFGTRNGKMHYGLDYAARAGSVVMAPEEGIVIYCGVRGEYGFVVDIDHGNGFVSRLTHLQEVGLELNQRVFRGDTIGTLAPLDDDSGKTPHLHYELLIDGVPHNPIPYFS